MGTTTSLSRLQRRAIALLVCDYAVRLREDADTGPTQPLLVSHDDVVDDLTAWAARIRAGDPAYLPWPTLHAQDVIAQAFDDFAARYRASDQSPSPTVRLSDVADAAMTYASNFWPGQGHTVSDDDFDAVVTYASRLWPQTMRQLFDVDAWLDPHADDVSDEAKQQLAAAADRIEKRWPAAEDEYLRLHAMNAATGVILSIDPLEHVESEHAAALRQYRAAHAALTGAYIGTAEAVPAANAETAPSGDDAR